MTGLDDSIQALSQSVLSDARAESQQILADAHQKAETIRQEAHQRAEAERKQILDQASQEVERMRSQLLSTTQLNARTIQLSGREELLDSVFEKAHKQLNSIQKWTDYHQVARTLTRDALIRLRAESARLRVDNTTRAALTEAALNELGKELNVNIQMGEPLEQGVGVIAETPDGRRQYDNTLETRLSRVQNALRSQVHHILMGEAQ
jgi:vacuolar-type H+-ATPase subunit E/Vma4